MKKVITVLLAALILVSCLMMAGCAKKEESKSAETCTKCNGTGMFINKWNQKAECPTCKGRGTVTK